MQSFQVSNERERTDIAKEEDIHLEHQTTVMSRVTILPFQCVPMLGIHQTEVEGFRGV